MGLPVQHDGGYVLTSDGRRDFGEITSEIAVKIKRESGKIRLEIGFQKDGRGYGESHIERPDRLVQLKRAGFDNARDFVEFVANAYDMIFQGKGNNIFIVRMVDTANIAFLSLKQNDKNKDVYWSVESAFISRKDYLNGKILLWAK